MSWHARRLVDLVDSLAGWFNRRRYDALARQLGRSPETPARNRRGFVIVQIDGLAYDYLLEAMARGYAPRLRQLLQQGRYRLARWRCGLPSTTPAVQAGLMFGDAFDIPGFRWYEKDRDCSVACKLPRGAQILQARVAASNRPGILRGGSSYMSLLDGDARLSLLTLASMRNGHLLENVKGIGFLLLFLLSPWRVVRMVALSLWEYGRDLVKRLITLFVPGHYESPRIISPFLKVIVDVVFRELQTFSAYLDIHRGTPAIYTNYYGYDEAAHHFGPNSPEAFRCLRGIDRQIGHLERLARRAQRCRYDFYVMSDHGQTPSIPFRQLYGVSLGQLITENVESTLSVDERSTGEQILETRAHILLEELRDIEARLRPAGARLLSAARRFVDQRTPLYDEAEWDMSRRNDVVVRSSGSLAHVYFNVSPRALDLSEVALLYPRLLPSLLEHPGIGWLVGRQEGQVVVMNRAGTLTLGRMEHVEGEHPLAGLPEPDHAARQLRRLARYPHSGDLILLGAWRNGRVVAFEDQVASHGGLGGAQDYPFIIYPAHATLSLDGREGPATLYEHFIRYQSGGDGASGSSETTTQPSPSRCKVSR
ncbi:MAG: hypothetical protein Kow0063_15690 [Anaerolineae bacterium]